MTDLSALIVEDLIRRPVIDGEDRRAAELLTAYFEGAPVESLRRLLRSRNRQLAELGAELAAELSFEGKSLLDEVVTLLGHESPIVRAFCLQCIQLWSNPAVHGPELAKAVALIRDRDAYVRRNVLFMLSTTTPEGLHAAAEHMKNDRADAETAERLRWLAGPETKSGKGVAEELESVDTMRHRFAAVAAARIARADSKTVELLRRAAKSDDWETRSFAAGTLEIVGAALEPDRSHEPES